MKRNTISKEDYRRIIRTQNHALKASYVVESNTTGSTHRILLYIVVFFIFRSSNLRSVMAALLSLDQSSVATAKCESVI